MGVRWGQGLAGQESIKKCVPVFLLKASVRSTTGSRIGIIRNVCDCALNRPRQLLLQGAIVTTATAVKGAPVFCNTLLSRCLQTRPRLDRSRGSILRTLPSLKKIVIYVRECSSFLTPPLANRLRVGCTPVPRGQNVPVSVGTHLFVQLY